MNAFVNTELADFMKLLIGNGSAQIIPTSTIRKVDVLRYYRETKQAFINFGSLLISQTDGRFILFNQKGELVGINRIKL